MRRFIVTGAPGAGKTAIIRSLELDGFSVVEEAATDVIAAAQAAGNAEPWQDPSFIDAVVRLQRDRQLRAASLSGDIQFHDRSAVCTAALAVYLGFPFSPLLQSELDRIRQECIFERRVFFVQSLGTIESTAARRISYDEAVRFGKIHQDVYEKHGFEMIRVEPGTPTERLEFIKAAITAAA